MLNFGVPQGSVLGPILLTLYTKPLTTLIRQHSIANQSFADDTQLYNSCRPDQIDFSVQSMQDGISDVKTWMTSSKLSLMMIKLNLYLLHQIEHIFQIHLQSPFTLGILLFPFPPRQKILVLHFPATCLWRSMSLTFAGLLT